MALREMPMRCIAGPIILLLTLLAGAAIAHNGEPRPGLPPYRRPARTPDDLKVARAALRWSWLHWWEANRELYLFSPAQDERRQAEADQLATLRKAAAEQLIEALQKSTRASAQIEAAMALGKLRHEPALPVLAEMATKASRPEARRAAVIAIGLLGTEAADKQLRQLEAEQQQQQNEQQVDEKVATLTAVGLLQSIDAATLRQLRAAITADARARAADKVGPSSVITWSLRHHRQDDNLEYFRNLLRTSISPWVASEALLGLGGTRDHAAQRLLESVLFGTALEDCRAYDNLENLSKSMVKAAVDAKGGINTRREDRDAERDEERTGARYLSAELIAMGWLRSSAAIAMGQLEAPRAGESLLRFIDESEVNTPYLVTPKSFAIMSLATYPSEASRDKFIALLGRPDDRGKLRIDVDPKSPLRGFAALGLGLYAKPYTTAQGPADHPGFEAAVMALAGRLEDEREEEEVRTACAVALGLTQRTAVLPILHRISGQFEQRNRRVDFPVFGYVLLGRALAGDTQLVETAGKFLLGRDDDTTPSGILSRRAAVLALGLTRSPNAIPVLTKAWHLNHYVNREVILALRLVGGNNAAKPVMDRLKAAKDEEERAYMAQALGELLAAERPTTLSRLTVGNNYTVRNDNLLPYQTLANGFLYEYLIASFGEDW